jgi:type III secretion protein R
MSAVENGILLALVALLPLIVLTLTSFVKLSVVLSLLRNALGTPDAPSGLVVTGLSLVLTFFVMTPVAVKMVQAAASAPPAPQQAPAPGMQPAPTPASPQGTPASPQGTPASPPGTPASPQRTAASPAPTATASTDIDAALRVLVPAQYQPQLAAAERAIEPLRAFLIKHTRGVDRETFAILATQMGNTVRGDEIYIMAPAFIATELREAFAIAVLIFVPFIVIDLVVALGLASLGLTTTSPQTVALPLKLLLFIAVDGWRLLLDGLLRGYI